MGNTFASNLCLPLYSFVVFPFLRNIKHSILSFISILYFSTYFRSLRDLCSDTPFSSDAYNNTTANTVVGGGPRSDATPIDYDPLHFIRCHAKDNDAGDSETKVWRCLFEPNPMRPDETTHVVATCGGECVCLINCETGKVMKRFKHMEEVRKLFLPRLLCCLFYPYC